MSKTDIIVPEGGESVTEAGVVERIIQDGDYAALDAPIIELETDKANMEVPAPAAGIVHWRVNAGDTVTPGQVIGHIEAAEKPADQVPVSKEEKAPESGSALAPPPLQSVSPSPSLEDVRENIDDYVADLSNPVEKAPAKAKASIPQEKRGEKEERREMSRMRKMIAKRLVAAKNDTAMLTTFNEVDMSAVMAIRAKEKEAFLKKHDVKLGFMGFFVKACVSALKELPDVNSFIDGTEIVDPKVFNVGIAVSTPRGLIVPVVKNCDKLSLAEIEKAILDFALRGRDGKITMDDMKDGTFTITNGGTFGSLLSTPILNPPQSAILGMHAIKKRPIEVDGKIELRPMMYLALSYDHRIIDGKEAVTFLVHVKDRLENPEHYLIYD